MPSRPLILIIEDTPSVAQSLETFLSSKGFRVLISDSAEEGLHLAKKNYVSAALVDLTLPGKDGNWFIRQLTKVKPHAQSIVLTISKDFERLVESFQSGACAYVVKPWNNEELLWTLRGSIEKSRLKRNNAFLLARASKARTANRMINSHAKERSRVATLLKPIARKILGFGPHAIKQLTDAQDELRRQVLVLALEKAAWNQSKAARLLGLTRNNLRFYLKSLNVHVPSKHGRPLN